MISEFLQFGYLGLLAMLIYFCYQIIDGSKESNRTFNQTLIILGFFTLFSLISGGVGYMWASKELEVAKTNESAVSMLKQQIEAIRVVHTKSMEPLKIALNSTVKKYNSSIYSSTRGEYLNEIDRINGVIQMREKLYHSEIEGIKNVFNVSTVK